MVNFKLILFLTIFMVIASLFFLKTDLASPQDQPKVEVFLIVRSGLPNPSWVINSSDEIAQLRQLINGLPNATPTASPTFGAFLLHSNEAISGFPVRVLVFDGVIQINTENNTTQFFQDTKGLRQFLASKAVEHGICADSDQRDTVVIEKCDSGVTNHQLGDLIGWCTIGDKISECAKGASNHGQFVSCVAQLTNDLKSNGVISDNDKGKIQSCAAQAKIP